MSNKKYTTLFICVIVGFCINHISAQNTFIANYDYDNYFISDTTHIKYVRHYLSLIVVTDSNRSFSTNKIINRKPKKIDLTKNDADRSILHNINTSSTDKIIFTQKNKYIVTETKNEVWQLLDDSTNIQGYTCFKAINKDSSIIVWYTNEIKVSTGPNGYFGLPGLVLHVQDLKKRCEIKFTKLHEANPDIIWPKNYISISGKYFLNKKLNGSLK